MTRERLSDLATVAVGALAPIVAGALLVAVPGTIDSTNIALILVVVVVAAGAAGGRMAGGCAAVTAALSFSFFHTKPYLSLRIASADDVETMTLLLIIGVVVGQIAAVAQQRGLEARRAAEDVRHVWRGVEQAVSGVPPSDVIGAARSEMVALLRLEACCWDPWTDAPSLPVLRSSGVFEPSGIRRFAGDDFELPSGGFDIPVRAEGRVVGYFRCVPTAGVGVGLDRRRTAVVLCDAVGLTLAGALRGLQG